MARLCHQMKAKMKAQPNHTKALAILKKEFGGNAVWTDKKSLFAASFDNARLSFLPDAVVRPKKEEDVGTLLTLANHYGIPVTPRGGGTATTGATSPIQGGWVLDFSQWRSVKIDAESGMATVQPGARIATIQRAAEKRGWFYPPDPSSIKYATIGGTIATNAGGMSGAKYGVTRDYILGLEGFLPTGEKVRWAAGLKKFASGYNMRDLWIGSEGTLGIITKAILKLIPKPQTRWTCLVAFQNETKALQAARQLLRVPLMPTILEFLDRQTVQCLETYEGKAIFADAGNSSLLLIELDGHPAQIEEEKEIIRQWAINLASNYNEASSPEEAETLWAARRTCSQAMFQLGDTKLNEDIVVPIKSYIPLINYTLKLKQDYGLATPTFGHLADGNFHVHIMFNREDKSQARQAEKSIQALMVKVIELGGAITGEHGIGLAKTPFLRMQHTKAEIDAMKAIKKTLDPNNILNPGKIFDPYEVWKKKPVKVRLPWDHK